MFLKAVSKKPYLLGTPTNQVFCYSLPGLAELVWHLTAVFKTVTYTTQNTCHV